MSISTEGKFLRSLFTNIFRKRVSVLVQISSTDVNQDINAYQWISIRAMWSITLATCHQVHSTTAVLIRNQNFIWKAGHKGQTVIFFRHFRLVCCACWFLQTAHICAAQIWWEFWGCNRRLLSSSVKRGFCFLPSQVISPKSLCPRGLCVKLM